MGKIPPSFRSAISTSLIRNPSSSSSSSSVTVAPVEKPAWRRPAKLKSSKKSSNTKVNHVVEQPSLFKSPNLSDAKALFSSLFSRTKGAPVDPNSLLKSYFSISTVQDSIAFLNYATKSDPSFSPDRSTFHALLLSSCKADSATLEPVHSVLNLMINKGLPPNQVTVDISVRALCSLGREDDAIGLIREFALKHSLPDSYTYNFMVKHLCKTRALSSAYNFIDDMRNSFDVKPDLVTYTILIDNVCNSKNLREATRLLDVLRDEGFKPDCFVYNTIMKGYCMLSRGGEVIAVYKKMKEEGVQPDLVTYNTLIFGLSKSGRVKDARKYLDVMVETGHFPDAATYTSLMNGMCREGDVKGALWLFEDMEAKGCEPNSCTYSTLLHGLCKARLLDKAMELYTVMKKGEIKLETGAYATFIRYLCRSGKVAEAYHVFDYAVESKSLSDVTAYSTLEGTLKWLKKAREQGLAV
ncbi:hypothetical protein SAY87_017042 [Trapa incisa]|uniref:Pentatricopeptide repeat-containing protein n=1 Tax=Trapa incisa TaxID=236973 RepID=A0AAN7LHX0_9MYRT|nr:hypothetical protein SAY87_017042 [Trapa incisa]